MRCLRRNFGVAVWFFLVAGFANLAIGQSAERVTPPHAVGVNPPPVQPAPPHTQIYAPPSTTPPYWRKLNNAPAVSVGAMLLLTDGRVLSTRSRTVVVRIALGRITQLGTSIPDITGSYLDGTWTQAASMHGRLRSALLRLSSIARREGSCGRRRVPVSRGPVRGRPVDESGRAVRSSGQHMDLGGAPQPAHAMGEYRRRAVRCAAGWNLYAGGLLRRGLADAKRAPCRHF